jgi:hypothetical protein
MAMHFMQEPIFPGEGQTIIFRHYQSSSISNGRETLVMHSLADGASHILFIDEDIAFDLDTLHVMARRREPFVACNYKIRFEGMPFAALDSTLERHLITDEHSPALEPCGNAGFGFALIAREVFEATPQPWFPIQWDSEAKTYSTEDLPFYQSVIAQGITPLIDHEASRKIAHIGHYRYRWNDPRDRSPTSE